MKMACVEDERFHLLGIGTVKVEEVGRGQERDDGGENGGGGGDEMMKFTLNLWYMTRGGSLKSVKFNSSRLAAICSS